jgi:hypothetical protein
MAVTGGWVEYPTNPVFDPTQRAYYPSVLYDANMFSSHGDSHYYKMWYATGSALRLAYSEDGINWLEQGGDLGVLTNAHHPVVLYDVSGFGGSIYYKIWYWNSASEYVDPIRYAESSDGINWVNDQAIGQDPSSLLVTGWVSPYWFYSSYGPGDVMYNPSGYATLNYADPMGNKYIMYYDAASQGSAPDGTVEGTALAYSADGMYWTRYGTEPVFKASAGSAWDSGYAYAWTVLKIGGLFKMWYGGGQAASSDGIGYAESADGISWTRQVNPVMHASDGIAWRSERTYTPLVIYDGNKFSSHGDSAYCKMWYTGKTGSNYAVGYAVIPLTQYYLTVKTDPPGAATISGEGWYDESAAVTLTAPPVSGSFRFWGWDIDGVPQGTTNPITVTMNANHTATAHYSNSAVGGEWAPIDTAQLITPWIVLALFAVVTAAAASHRLLRKRW